MAVEKELLEATPEGGEVYVLRETADVQAERRRLRDDEDRHFVLTEGQAAMLDHVQHLADL